MGLADDLDGDRGWSGVYCFRDDYAGGMGLQEGLEGGEVTEEEAKLKWCPFSRASHNKFEPSLNRYISSNEIPEGCRCIASRCMAWRWNDSQQNALGQKERPQGEGWEQVGNFWTRTPSPGDRWRPGYCGLAEPS